MESEFSQVYEDISQTEVSGVLFFVVFDHDQDFICAVVSYFTRFLVVYLLPNESNYKQKCRWLLCVEQRLMGTAPVCLTHFDSQCNSAAHL